MNARFCRVMCLIAAGCMLGQAQEGAFQLFAGRDVTGHPPEHDRALLEALLASKLGLEYGRIKPERSLLLSDCLESSLWCGDSDFAFLNITSDAAKGLNLASGAALTKAWYLSASEDARFGFTVEPWQGNLSDAPFQLLAIVNRMDQAHWVKEHRKWEEAEVRFVYGHKSNDSMEMTLIVEFVMRPLDWLEFWQLAGKWHALGRVADKEFLNGLREALRASHYKNPLRVRIRTNLNESGPWSMSEWDLDRTTRVREGEPLERSYLEDQISDKFIRASPGTDDYKKYTVKLWPDVSSMSGPHHIKIDPDFLHKEATPYGAQPNGPPGMPTPKNFCATTPTRNALALERCTGCHMTESATPFTHISNRPKGGSSVLSGFLTGGSRNPSLEDIFYGRVFQVDVKYDSFDVSGNVCDQPAVKCVTRKFYDLGRRRLFLAAVLIGGPYFTEQARALIEAYRTNYSD
jgi:hypothetical protein